MGNGDDPLRLATATASMIGQFCNSLRSNKRMLTQPQSRNSGDHFPDLTNRTASSHGVRRGVPSRSIGVITFIARRLAALGGAATAGAAISECGAGGG